MAKTSHCYSTCQQCKRRFPNYKGGKEICLTCFFAAANPAPLCVGREPGGLLAAEVVSEEIVWEPGPYPEES